MFESATRRLWAKTKARDVEGDNVLEVRSYSSNFYVLERICVNIALRIAFVENRLTTLLDRLPIPPLEELPRDTWILIAALLLGLKIRPSL
jgi:hypothetical protein